MADTKPSEGAMAAADQWFDSPSGLAISSLFDAPVLVRKKAALARIVDKHTALRWTDERPTEPGSYWYRYPPWSWVVRVYDESGELYVEANAGPHAPNTNVEDYARQGGKWCRIPEPVEANDA